MLELTSWNWHKIKGRGDVAVINEVYPILPANPRTLTGQQVLIDGIQYEAKGIEMFAIPADEEHPYRNNISILVGQRVLA